LVLLVAVLEVAVVPLLALFVVALALRSFVDRCFVVVLRSTLLFFVDDAVLRLPRNFLRSIDVGDLVAVFDESVLAVDERLLLVFDAVDDIDFRVVDFVRLRFFDDDLCCCCRSPERLLLRLRRVAAVVLFALLLDRFDDDSSVELLFVGSLLLSDDIIIMGAVLVLAMDDLGFFRRLDGSAELDRTRLCFEEEEDVDE